MLGCGGWGYLYVTGLAMRIVGGVMEELCFFTFLGVLFCGWVQPTFAVFVGCVGLAVWLLVVTVW